MSKKEENQENIELSNGDEQLDLLDAFDQQEEQEEQEVSPKKKKAKKKEVTFTGTDGTEYTEEQWNSPVIQNGPTRKEVEGWKERYGMVYLTPFDGASFVWRKLDRPEYREIISNPQYSALDREELFTEKCVLFPYNFSMERIKNGPAGVASLLSEMIMDKSGFVAQSAPIKL